MTSLVLIMLMLGSNSMGQLLLSKNDIDVPIGREVFLQPSDLQFQNVVAEDICKVEVLLNEPMSQRVGTLEPQVFDCRFKQGTVKYSHHGSPLLQKDTVKLRAYKFLKRDTISEFFDLNFTITNDSYRVVQLLHPLVVEEFMGLTDFINESLINFNYSRSEGAICKARLSRYLSNRPAHGQIVLGREMRPVDVIKRKCDDFLNLGLQYKHLKPPTPNIDYISIIIEVSDPFLNNGEPVSEWVYIPVEIRPCSPNLPPKPTFSGMYLMDIDQFIVTTISPAVLSSTDNETPSEQLIYNISKPLSPRQGFLVHLSEHTRAITSFRQSDLNNFDIAYKPPSQSFKERQNFEIGFTVYDGDFLPSAPFILFIVVRPAVTKAPRVLMNSGMVLLEGQSRPLKLKNLEIVDSDNIKDVQIFVTGGLHHGKLEVAKRPAVSFTQKDIESGKVVYHHDDSDSTKDSLHLRIYDGSHSTHVKFPISIIPKDDNPPSLVVNMGLKVEEGKSVPITQSVLRAVDQDTSDEHIIFIIKRPPTAGTIWKRFAWEKEGEIVHDFTQRDVSKSLVYYHHNGNEVFVDYLEVTIHDANNPPNFSPVYKVMVHVIPIGDDPPKPDLASSFSIHIPETDLAVLGSKHLRYVDADSTDDQIIYTITEAPRFIGSFLLSDPGKFVSVASKVFLAKEADSIEITNFTQEEVNHHRIAYMPPMDDIGPNPLYLQYIFSVTNKHRNVVTGQVFNITLLPVNNQMPQLHTGQLFVEEGSSTLLSTNELSVYDPDTLRSDLQMSLFTIPLHGSLCRSSQPLRVGDLLSLDDILTLRLEYKHDGSESFKDRFKVGVNDGLHFIAGDVLIEIEPVDDELPVWEVDLLDHISVDEHGMTKLTSEILAATDVDTDDNSLLFILTKAPQHGSVLLDNRKVNKFSQRDVIRSAVSYVHDGQEIGPVSKEDYMTFIVTDQAFPRLASHPSHKILIKIMPQNNQSPTMSFKKVIRVTEGQQSAVTEDNIFASDQDTVPDEITIMIVKQPEYSHLENMRTRLGYEALNVHQSVDSFTMQDVKKGFVLFVQSNHRGLEPESDSFEVLASDGLHNSSSVLVLVSIDLQNDEEPLLTISNITLDEGGAYSLDNKVSGSDRDFPEDLLVISVKSPPSNGFLTQTIKVADQGPLLDVPFKEISLMKFNNISYKHDGSENFLDSFELVLSDGFHRTYATCHVTINPINDEPPKIVRNIIARNVELQGSFLISSALLLAIDLDTEPDHLAFIPTKLPDCGELQKKINIGSSTTPEWLSAQNFTQADVDHNLLRYQHNATDPACYEDEFHFLVTDGVHQTPSAVFKIELVDIGKTDLTVIVGNATIDMGAEFTFNSSMLHAFDGTSQFEDISFNVINPPQWGILSSQSNISVSVFAFSILDLLKGDIFYRHSNLSQSQEDSFDLYVTNGVVGQNVTFVIYIILPEPLIVDVPSLELVSPLHINENDNSTSTFITADNLLTKDSISNDGQITYIITRLPAFGNLMYRNSSTIQYSFTQEDINKKFVSYKINHTALTYTEQFYFIVSNGRGEGFLMDGRMRNDSVSFQITVEQRQTSEPVVRVVPPHFIQTVWNRHLGFLLSDRHLKISLASVSSSNLRFYVVQYLQHGYIFHVLKEKSVRFFTQSDIDNNHIVIILKPSSETRDFFTFQVAGDQTTYNKEHRMDLFWASIYFPSPEFSVCEDSGILNISVHRKGNLNSSSYVRITAIGQSAKEVLDYVPSRAKKIQFDPGASTAFWQIIIVQDDLEEAPIEQVQIMLYEPENALIGFHNQTLVSIYDLNRGSCSLLNTGHVPSSTEKSEEEDADDLDEESENTSPSSMVCDQHIYGLLQYNRSTGGLFECNGRDWVSWSPSSSSKKDGVGGRNLQPEPNANEEEPPKRHEVVTSTESTHVTSVSCPQGWHQFGRDCHKFQRQQSTWSAAQAICQTYRSSNLVFIKSKEHNEWLVQLARSKPFWIGLHASAQTNEWRYKETRRIHYTNWKKGFPRLPPSGEMKHKCVLVRGSGFWINRHCEYHEHSFICSHSVKY